MMSKLSENKASHQKSSHDFDTKRAKRRKTQTYRYGEKVSKRSGNRMTNQRP